MHAYAFGAGLILAVALALAPPTAEARDQIRVVGSSTLFPFAVEVAERFGESGDFKTPMVESTGTGGGLKLFCAGVGTDHPDIVNASRRIRLAEFNGCAKNGVSQIVEIKLGLDGIVLADALDGPSLAISPTQLFLALAKQVPNADGKLVANPNRAWNQIDPSLPAEPIEVYGPPPTSGTRDSFEDLVLEPGAAALPALAALKQSDPKAYDGVWKTIRDDGAYIDAGENDALVAARLAANPKAFGLFGFSFLAERRDSLKGAEVGGVAPSAATIAARSYPLARPIYLYVKKQHLGTVAGIREFLREFTADKTIGADGYLSRHGLVPLPADDIVAAGTAAAELPSLTRDGL